MISSFTPQWGVFAYKMEWPISLKYRPLAAAYYLKIIFRYYLYTTRLGYAYHLRKLTKIKGKGPHSVTQPTTLSPGENRPNKFPCKHMKHLHLLVFKIFLHRGQDCAHCCARWQLLLFNHWYCHEYCCSSGPRWPSSCQGRLQILIVKFSCKLTN